MLKWARRMRFDTEDAKREIGDLGRGLSGHIRIGIVPTAAQFPVAARRAAIDAGGARGGRCARQWPWSTRSNPCCAPASSI
jgi:hypothetical protein